MTVDTVDRETEIDGVAVVVVVTVEVLSAKSLALTRTGFLEIGFRFVPFGRPLDLDTVEIFEFRDPEHATKYHHPLQFKIHIFHSQIRGGIRRSHWERVEVL